jgi:hypothetical protein
MLGRQQRVLDAFQRVQDWLRRNRGNWESPSLARRCEALDDAVARAERAAAHQSSGQRRSQDATVVLRGRVRVLRVKHLQPLSAIARALSGESVEIRNAFRLPRARTPVAVLLAAARGVHSSAMGREELFIDCGQPADFLARLDDAVREVEHAVRRRDRAMQLHVGATAALVEYLGRARRLVEQIDCHVRTLLDGDEARLAERRATRRVHLRGAARASESEGGVVSELRPVKEVVRLVAA